MIEAWQGEHRGVAFTSIATGDALSEFGHGEDMDKIIPIVERWTRLEYLYGRMMDPVSVAEQVVNALASRETIRRIAITPSYPDPSETPETPGEDGARAQIEQQRAGETTEEA